MFMSVCLFICVCVCVYLCMPPVFVYTLFVSLSYDYVNVCVCLCIYNSRRICLTMSIQMACGNVCHVTVYPNCGPLGMPVDRATKEDWQQKPQSQSMTCADRTPRCLAKLAQQ